MQSRRQNAALPARRVHGDQRQQPHHHQNDIVSSIASSVSSSHSQVQKAPTGHCQGLNSRPHLRGFPPASEQQQKPPDRGFLIKGPRSSVTESVAFLPEARACDSLSSCVISSALIVQIRQMSRFHRYRNISHYVHFLFVCGLPRKSKVKKI